MICLLPSVNPVAFWSESTRTSHSIRTLAYGWNLMGSKPVPFLPSPCHSVLPVSRPHHGSHAHFPDWNSEAQSTNAEHGTQRATQRGFQLLHVIAITSQVWKDSDFCPLLPRKPSPSERSASLDVHQIFKRTAPTMIPRWYIYLSDYAGGQCLDSPSTN